MYYTYLCVRGDALLANDCCFSFGLRHDLDRNTYKCRVAAVD